jgi:hypothetical protein
MTRIRMHRSRSQLGMLPYPELYHADKDRGDLGDSTAALQRPQRELHGFENPGISSKVRKRSVTADGVLL